MNAVFQLLLAAEDGALESELRTLLPTSGMACHMERLHAMTQAATADAIIVDQRSCPMSLWKALLSSYAGRLIVLTGKDDKENINELLEPTALAHIIGRNARNCLREILITLKKFKTTDIFGLDKYFAPGVDPVSALIHQADEINPAIERLLAGMHLGSSFSATVDLLRLTANELCTNAVYNAPVDQFQNPKYEGTDRRLKVKLQDQEVVSLSMCCDDEYVGIAVRDQFGRLERDKIVKHLVKCANNTKFIESKRGGAGAGVYLAFHSANQFIVNIDPGKQLEMICILEKSKRYKDYRLRVTSFNYFTAQSGVRSVSTWGGVA